MRYVLRADASQSIGSGHVMRSSAIAEELIARGKAVIFVGQISNLPWVEARIASLGFTEIHNRPSEFISNPASDVLLLDSYEIDINDTFIAFEDWLHIVVIVDEQTPSYHCTLRIHPGLESPWIRESQTPTLAGPNYIPFRTSLAKNKTRRKKSIDVLKIAVVAGGSDPYQLVNEIAKVLSGIQYPFEAYLFTNSHKNEISDSRFNYVDIGPQLDDVIQNIDLVLTTSSGSSLEFIASGLPIGVACVVDNQKQCYESLGKLGLAVQIGFLNSHEEWNLNKELIYELIESSEIRECLIAKASGLIDFNGAGRIVDAIMNLHPSPNLQNG